MADVIFSEPIRGKSVIDIGCWDGYFSIEAARRGATSVLATDDFVWRTGITKRRNTEIAAEVVGVLYHMRHPLLALEKAASVCSDLLILETHIDAMNEARLAMIF